MVVSARSDNAAPAPERRRLAGGTVAAVACIAAVLAIAALVWQAIAAGGAPDPLTARGTSAATLDVAVLVFREGLECVLVLAAITAGLRPEAVAHRRPIVWGVI